MKTRNIMMPQIPTDPNDMGSYEKELEENLKRLREVGVDVNDIDFELTDTYNIKDNPRKVQS
jgi:hypothetical protein